MGKKLLSVLLTLALLLSLIPAGYAADIEIVDEPVWVDVPDVPLAVGDIVASGQCGENLFWTLDDQGTLTITGTGDMWNSIGAQGYGGAWSEYGAQIRSVIIEDGATSFGVESFKNCDNITSVDIPGSVLTIGNQAFLNCSALESLSLKEGLIGIGYESFSGCSSLRQLTIPDSVTALSVGAFSSCGSLRSVAIGSGLKSFFANDFYFCDSLTEMTVSEDNPYYCSVDNVIFTKDGKTLFCCPNGKSGAYRIPDGTTAVGQGAFSYCAALTSVTLPDSVAEIGLAAFSDCSGLTELRFEGAAPSFGEYCFDKVTATAYYPGFDLSWTDEVKQDYGAGTITWVAEADLGLPVDEEHFPDEIFRDYVAENFDEDGDGCLNDEEIAAITDIEVSMMGIASLRGIEFFPELVTLYCLDNELTELDLSGNPKLEELDCSFNSLTALDVSQNPALTSIDCNENAITALDVSQNPALEGLFCYSNEIAALDLSANPELLVLDCSSNALTTLDLSENAALVMLECYGNDIAALDLSPCPTLVDIVTNGTYEQKANFDSYTKDSYFVHVDPTTELITELSGDGFKITVTDYTQGKAACSLEAAARYSGSVVFTVEAETAVLVAVKDGETFTRVPCAAGENGEHSFSILVNKDTELALAFLGDTNLNGVVEALDGTMVKRVAMETYTYDTQLKALLSDVNADGVIAALEGTMISRAALGTYALPWQP